MKTSQKIMVLSSLVFIGLTVFSCGSNEKITEEKTIKIKRTGTEDVIDLERHIVNADYGNLRMRMSQYCIHVDSATSLPEKLMTISKNAVDTLKEMAKRLDPTYSGRYISAVKIIYGLNASKDNMKLYFQPVLLKTTGNNSIKKDVIYIPLISSTSYKYVNSPPYFAVVSQEKVDSAVANYTTHITFKKENSRYYRGFRSTALSDSILDVKSIMYTIQEMDSVMAGNETDEILIFNAAEEMYVRNVPYLKHSLLLGSVKILKRKDSKMFYMKYGNLSHLCPPSCNTEKKFNIK